MKTQKLCKGADLMKNKYLLLVCLLLTSCNEEVINSDSNSSIESISLSEVSEESSSLSDISENLSIKSNEPTEEELLNQYKLHYVENNTYIELCLAYFLEHLGVQVELGYPGYIDEGSDFKTPFVEGKIESRELICAYISLDTYEKIENINWMTFYFYDSYDITLEKYLNGLQQNIVNFEDDKVYMYTQDENVGLPIIMGNKRLLMASSRFAYKMNNGNTLFIPEVFNKQKGTNIDSGVLLYDEYKFGDIFYETDDIVVKSNFVSKNYSFMMRPFVCFIYHIKDYNGKKVIIESDYTLSTIKNEELYNKISSAIIEIIDGEYGGKKIVYDYSILRTIFETI